MPIFDDIRDLVRRLAPRGWDELLAQHGLHLDAADLATELQRPLADAHGKSTIDRTLPGFEDFATAGRAAITPGNPALSLLYHALASPSVAPSASSGTKDFASLAELDTVENYIYSLARRRLADFTEPVIAVFAYQYRAGTRSVHRVHADMVYSRTGIARVGTTAPHYEPFRRSFWVAPSADGPGVAVMPARYAAFLAERRRLSARDAVMHPLDGPLAGDAERVFLVPVHKLFAGDECLVGETVPPPSFREYHRSEKLRKIHQVAAASGGVTPLPGFDIDQKPFVRESPDLVGLEAAGASTLLVPTPRPTLVETAKQRNSMSDKLEIVRYRVPKENDDLLGRGNRFETSSFQIPVPEDRDTRAAPEYANMRQHVRPTGELFDLNALPLADFHKVLRDATLHGIAGVENGPLEAAHFVDATCDGAIAVDVTLSRTLSRYAALSLVAAPDFLPLVDQLEVQRWAERRGLGENFFAQGAPAPLCYGRGVGQNPAVLDPISRAGTAFDRADAANHTATAVLSGAPQSAGDAQPLRVSVSTGWLPDSAADVFEPGWDTAMSQDADGEFYANYGLGSPFPEDAKLCAALNSFWPAAAPDVGRTFGRMTALPLLDEELGMHPQHPKVLAGAATSAPGWDNEFGPFFAVAGTQVNISAIERSDYTLNALHGRLGIGLLGRIDAVELLARMDAFRECADRLRGHTAMRNFTDLLVTAEKVADWSQREDRLDPSLHGPGYLYVFARIGTPREVPAEPRRMVAVVDTTFVCQVTADRVGVRRDQAAPTVTPWRHPVPAGG